MHSAHFLWVHSFHIRVLLLFFNKSLRLIATVICLSSKDFFLTITSHMRLVHNTLILPCMCYALRIKLSLRGQERFLRDTPSTESFSPSFLGQGTKQRSLVKNLQILSVDTLFPCLFTALYLRTLPAERRWVFCSSMCSGCTSSRCFPSLQQEPG